MKSLRVLTINLFARYLCPLEGHLYKPREHTDVNDDQLNFQLLSMTPADVTAAEEAEAPYGRADTCLVMGPLWHKALRNLEPNVEHKARDLDCLFIEQFYSNPCFDDMCEMTVGCPGATLRYHRNFKAANSNIICNMAAIKECPIGISKTQGAPVVDFSFVRDPTNRFVSAYTEIEFRKSITPLNLFTPKPHWREELGSQARARSFFLDLLMTQRIERMPPFHNGDEILFHSFSMVGAFKRAGAKVMGTLGSFEEGWQQFVKLAGVNVSFNESCFPHPHGTHPAWNPRIDKNVKLSMAYLLSQDRSVLQALHCAILLPDFVCLGYKSAMQPGECESAGYTLQGKSWNQTVAEIRRVHCPEGIQLMGGGGPYSHARNTPAVSKPARPSRCKETHAAQMMLMETSSPSAVHSCFDDDDDVLGEGIGVQSQEITEPIQLVQQDEQQKERKKVSLLSRARSRLAVMDPSKDKTENATFKHSETQ